MKHSLYALSFLFAALGAALPVYSQAAAKPQEVKHAPEGDVRKVLSKLEYVSEEKPSMTAQYYIYLESAMWCSPCWNEMKKIPAFYEEMKKDGRVELILVSYDHSPEEALEFRNMNKGTFPITMRPGDHHLLPGKAFSRGIPHMSIVTPEGKLIFNGNGNRMKDWRSLTIDAEPSEPTLIEALGNLEYISSQKPSGTAKYYILLESASWCGPCRQEMPMICKMYEEMKADGRVELILISNDRSSQSALAFRDENAGTFPITMRSGSSCKLPGKVAKTGIPNITIIDDQGKTITSGHGAQIRLWKHHTIEAQIQ